MNHKIKNIKISILKKKILLNFIIDSYSWWDRLYRWIHTLLAIISPIVVIIQYTIQYVSVSGTFSIILSIIVAVMIKLKEYLKYDKIKDIAKTQSAKYTILYDSIESELSKNKEKRQSIDEFLYWINREYNNIEVNDPEVSHRDKNKFIKLCKKKNIPYDEDISMLNELVDIGVDKCANSEIVLDDIKIIDTTDVADADADGNDAHGNNANINNANNANKTLDESPINNRNKFKLTLKSIDSEKMKDLHDRLSNI